MCRILSLNWFLEADIIEAKNHRKSSTRIVNSEPKIDTHERERFNSDLIDFPISEYSHHESFAAQGVDHSHDSQNEFEEPKYITPPIPEELEESERESERKVMSILNTEIIKEERLEIEAESSEDARVNINEFIEQEKVKDYIHSLKSIRNKVEELMQEIEDFGEIFTDEDDIQDYIDSASTKCHELLGLIDEFDEDLEDVLELCINQRMYDSPDDIMEFQDIYDSYQDLSKQFRKDLNNASRDFQEFQHGKSEAIVLYIENQLDRLIPLYDDCAFDDFIERLNGLDNLIS